MEGNWKFDPILDLCRQEAPSTRIMMGFVLAVAHESISVCLLLLNRFDRTVSGVHILHRIAQIFVTAPKFNRDDGMHPVRLNLRQPASHTINCFCNDSLVAMERDTDGFGIGKQSRIPQSHHRCAHIMYIPPFPCRQTQPNCFGNLSFSFTIGEHPIGE